MYAQAHQLRNWFVWCEGAPSVIGPVTVDQLARGIRAGKVPADASIQREGDVWWSGILDEPEVIQALKALPEDLPPSVPPPSGTHEVGFYRSRDPRR
jgi:hypothetical protein